jgi:hypothetical protein
MEEVDEGGFKGRLGSDKVGIGSSCDTEIWFINASIFTDDDLIIIIVQIIALIHIFNSFSSEFVERFVTFCNLMEITYLFCNLRNLIKLLTSHHYLPLPLVPISRMVCNSLLGVILGNNFIAVEMDRLGGSGSDDSNWLIRKFLGGFRKSLLKDG